MKHSDHWIMAGWRALSLSPSYTLYFLQGFIQHVHFTFHFTNQGQNFVLVVQYFDGLCVRIIAKLERAGYFRCIFPEEKKLEL